jgi:hypothetical protein
LADLSKAEIAAMPIRGYLDQTVMPVLLEGMKQLAKDRLFIFLTHVISLL